MPLFQGFRPVVGTICPSSAAAVVGPPRASQGMKKGRRPRRRPRLKLSDRAGPDQCPVPGENALFPAQIAGFLAVSRPVPVYPVFLKYVVSVQAFTYLVKPLNVDELTVFIEQALSMKKITEECAYLKEELNSHYSYHEIVGTSPPIQKIFRMIDRLKDVDTGVMIYGESGTGKELVARALHQLGHRSSNRFVAINCAAVPESLMEDELFGHKRGTFTGAAQDRKGKLEIADKGTLFLDEIGDMPLALQGKLLRVLQQKEYSPLGSNEVYPLDIRVLAATNRNLERMIQEGSFRQDLYFRLNVVSITMPPLRERREDIPLLCSYFLRKLEEAQKREHMTVSPQALDALMAYDYPGNVRQLSNILEHAMILSSGSTIDLDSLPDVVRCATLPLSRDFDFSEIPNITIREMEKRMIQASLYRNHGKREATASELGISLRSLFNKIKEYDIALEKS